MTNENKGKGMNIIEAIETIDVLSNTWYGKG
jgi:hypothetical protein